MTNQTTITHNAATFQSRDSQRADADRGRAVEIQLATGDGQIIWRTGEIVSTFANGQLFTVFKDETPRAKFTAEREQLRDPLPPYHVIKVGCPVCHDRADARRIDNTFKTIRGVTYKYNCATCGRFIAGEPTITAPQTSPTFERHVYDDQEHEGSKGAFFAAMNSGQLVEIDDGWFEEMLDVLPPKGMSCMIEVQGVHRFASFLFAEGAMNLVAFWTARQANGSIRYFCQMTNIENPDA